MNTEQLLAELASLGAKLEANGDALKCYAPHGVLSNELLQAIRMRKRELLAFIQKGRGRDASAASLSRCPQGQPVPLTFAQERIWFFEQFMPGNPFYNMPLAVKLNGKLDIARLRDVFHELARRHEALRTVFSEEEGVLTQVVRPNLSIDCPLEDLSTEEAALREARVQQRIQNEVAQPFDLARGPLIRIGLVRLGEWEYVLLLTMHHIVSDGWSMGVLLREASVLYEAFCRGEPSSLAELPFRYTDYAYWQRTESGENKLDAHLHYWKQQLAGAPTLLNLPTDKPRASSPGLSGKRERSVLPRGLVQQAESLARSLETTLYAVLLASLKLLLFRWTGQRDLIVGTVVAGRTHPHLEGVIGCFMNSLVLRTQVAGAESAQDLINGLSAGLFDAYRHQDCPIEKLIEALNPPRTLGVNPLFNVAFLLQNFPVPERFSQDIETEVIPAYSGGLNLDLRFVASEINDEFSFECEYNPELFDSATICHLLDTYGSILERLVETPEASVASFQLSPTLERQVERARSLDKSRSLVIAATFTAEPIRESIEFWMETLTTPTNISFAPYAQVFQTLLAPDSILAANNDVNVLMLRLEDWWAAEGDFEGRTKRLHTACDEFMQSLTTYRARCTATTFIVLCPASSQSKNSREITAFLDKVESKLREESSAFSGVYSVGSKEVFEYYDVPNYEDPEAEAIGHIPYTSELFTALGTLISRKIAALCRRPYKAIVLDCDNTLWQGICAEDGADGVRVTEPYEKLQSFLLKQYAQGMLLCLNSKNREEDVLAVFEQHPNMRLALDHIASHRINWAPKSENLKAIAAELNIGLDALIFIDDNPLECAEVEANCPAVLVLQLPDRSEDIANFLPGVWELDCLAVTVEGSSRADSYRQNRQRMALQQSALSFEDYLSRLELHVHIEPVGFGDLERIAELTQRTNQFNMSSIRRNTQQIAALLRSTQFEGISVRVADRFGDYGLTGVVLYGERDGMLVIDTFLLSCRVLGRRVEHQVMSYLFSVAASKRCSHIVFTYRRTERNQPVLDFLMNQASQWQQKTSDGAVFEIPVRGALIELSADIAVRDVLPQKDLCHE